MAVFSLFGGFVKCVCPVDCMWTTAPKKKTRMLGSIVSRLASPTAHWRKNLGWKKIWGEKKLSTQDSIKHPEMDKKIVFKNKICSKLPELPRNHVSGMGGGSCYGGTDNWTDNQHRRVTSTVAPCCCNRHLSIFTSVCFVWFLRFFKCCWIFFTPQKWFEFDERCKMKMLEAFFLCPNCTGRTVLKPLHVWCSQNRQITSPTTHFLLAKKFCILLQMGHAQSKERKPSETWWNLSNLEWSMQNNSIDGGVVFR